MPIYHVKREFSGYVRGHEIREVIADSEEEAKESFYAGNEISSEIIRDDTSTNSLDAELQIPPKKVVLSPKQQLLYKTLYGKLP